MVEPGDAAHSDGLAVVGNRPGDLQVRIQTGSTEWLLTPLQDDQELDSRQSVGAVYWEGAVTVTRDGKPAGRGYFEMTGYVKSRALMLVS